jgi:hypothetical protein
MESRDITSYLIALLGMVAAFSMIAAAAYGVF